MGGCVGRHARCSASNIYVSHFVDLCHLRANVLSRITRFRLYAVIIEWHLQLIALVRYLLQFIHSPRGQLICGS